VIDFSLTDGVGATWQVAEPILRSLFGW
jgi:hypothetical protein